MFNEKKRKHKKVKTSTLLDEVAVDYEYDEKSRKQRELQHEYSDELEERDPFSHIKMKLERHEKRIKELESTVGLLLKHMHTDGKVVIEIDD